MTAPQRPTIHDVARIAGVSLATVDRVLNARGSVAAKSVAKVRQAVATSGYVANRAAATLARGRDYRLHVVLPTVGGGFAARLTAALDDQSARWRPERVVIDTARLPPFDAPGLAAHLATLTPGAVDGVAIMGSASPMVTAQIARLMAAGVPVVTLVSDMPGSGRALYVGPDNVMAGRTAALFLGRFLGARTGCVLVVAGSLRARDHTERRFGFDALMAERFGDQTVLPTVEAGDRAERVEALVRAAMAADDIVGIYSIGAGNAGLVRAVTEIAAARRPVTVVHELTGPTRAALLNGTVDLVIDQTPALEVAQAIEALMVLIEGRLLPDGLGRTALALYSSENLPESPLREK